MSLVLIGGGGHAHAIADVATSVGFSVAGVLTRSGVVMLPGLNVLGSDEWIESAPAGTSYHLAFGPQPGCELRAAKFEDLATRGLSLPAIISPNAISRIAGVGEGSVVLHGAILNIGANIGRNCIINTGAIVEHHCEVGDHSHIAPGATLGGAVRVGARCIIGLGAVLLPAVSLATGVTIGAGAVVLRSIEEPFTTWVGNPARRLI